MYTQKPHGKYSYRLGVSFIPQLTIYNTNKEIIEWIAKKYNGQMNKSRKRSEKRKAYWEVRFWYARMVKILTEVLPYLRIKKKQAELLLEFYRLPPYKPPKRDDAVLMKQLEIYNKLRVLNVRGVQKPKLMIIKNIPDHAQIKTVPKETLERYVNEGLTVYDIADKMSCHPQTIRRRITIYGLNYKKGRGRSVLANEA